MDYFFDNALVSVSFSRLNSFLVSEKQHTGSSFIAGVLGTVRPKPDALKTGELMVDIVRYYLNLLALKTGKGQGLVEYALIIVLISLVCITILNTLGSSIVSVFSKVNSGMAP
ncbi:MAG: Flp family type IVb pilin [Chloroflexota bacterium]